MPAQKGLSLRQASRAYATDEILQLLKSAQAAVDDATAAKWWQTRKNQTLIQTIERTTLAQQRHMDLMKAIEAAYANLQKMLSAGTLNATGIRTKPTVEIKPGPVPAYIFDNPNIDWDKDVAENAGSKFELVRVHGPEVRLETQIGRPTKKALIVRWLTDLSLGGSDLAGNQDRLCDSVRDQAASEGYSRDGLSDSVIKPLIRQVRKELSEANT